VSLARYRKKDWISLLKKHRNRETNSLVLKDAAGQPIRLEGPHIAVEDLVPLIPPTAYREVTVGDTTSWTFPLAVRLPGRGKVHRRELKHLNNCNETNRALFWSGEVPTFTSPEEVSLLVPVHHTDQRIDVQPASVVGDTWMTEVVPRVPAALAAQARVRKACQRGRGVATPADLLRAVLAHGLGALSTRRLGAWAVLLGLADLAETAGRVLAARLAPEAAARARLRKDTKAQNQGPPPGRPRGPSPPGCGGIGRGGTGPWSCNGCHRASGSPTSDSVQARNASVEAQVECDT
jgi:hypothetical protein